MNPSRDLRFEGMLVKLMAYCKANNVTAHTYRHGPALVFRPKPLRISKINMKG